MEFLWVISVISVVKVETETVLLALSLDILGESL